MTKNLELNNYLVSTMQKIFDPIPVPLILLDRNTQIIMINDIFANYLGYEKSYIIGKKVQDVDKYSRFPYVFQTKKSEIAWKHKFENGHTGIVHRIPILDENGEVDYGFGMVLFQDMEQFRDIIEKNKLLETEIKHYRNRLRELSGAKYSWENIISRSIIMNEIKSMGRKASMTSSNVLILGESGTGKELFAHSIHNDSRRHLDPFVKVNCAAIPEELLESELFGYVDGAFTGAKKGGKIGKFQLANKGSIFLDEIGDMPLNMQSKLLRVLQEREIERIGSNKTQNIDIRVIAATNKRLEELVEEGKFREDLYYRLNVMSIEIPPLRKRIDDIESLSKLLLKKISKQLGKYVNEISHEAMDYLKSHDWPGNVRELENILERAVNLTDNNRILTRHLSNYITKTKKEITIGPVKSIKEIIEKAERKAIIEALTYTKGNKLKASNLLKISRSNLYDKIERYNISV
ncbi:sigma-54 interaction domain-containing protein [Senegalia massiliensis]|uniref:AAA family ATPase n=1 Tax=Senegalia massiliensis TaxID=1720316 RepID=A0A845R4N4_9CLOT|nr:sigma 54-interacting transcriptional regulator [Senegalia massiliensis]NBI07463.1 AAA family ATPase [Senegalia massiliensis]